MKNSSKHIIVFLSIIGAISIFLKLHTFDFSIPIHFDNLGYALDSIQYSQGDYFIPQKKNPGWPLFVTPFYAMINSENFIDYSNMLRILGLSISTVSIIPMYILAKKFFKEKFALMATALFAFEPHLNYIAGQGVSEPIFILVFILSILFILKSEMKYVYLSFILGGIFWWIRLEGFYLVIVLSIIYFINYRKTKYAYRNYIICMLIFLVVISPMFIQRYVQYDDPFYVWYNTTLFAENYGTLVTSPDDASVQDYFKQNDIFSFLDRFVLQGISNLISGLVKISYPYLFILIPFGFMFSLRPVDQNIKFIKSNWAIIIATIAILIIPFSTIPDRRFLFPLFPFLIIFATIPIQRVIEYGLSTFSYPEKSKNFFFVIIVGLVLLLGGIFTFGIGPYGYGQQDTMLQEEKIHFTEFLYDNLDGRMLHSSDVTEFLKYVQVVKTEEGFKSYESPKGRDPYPDIYSPGKLTQISAYGKTMEELIENGRNLELKYISLSDKESAFFPFFKESYDNPEQHQYLKKIYDTKELGYEKLKIKIFEIDYEKFDSISKNE